MEDFFISQHNRLGDELFITNSKNNVINPLCSMHGFVEVELKNIDTNNYHKQYLSRMLPCISNKKKIGGIWKNVDFLRRLPVY